MTPWRRVVLLGGSGFCGAHLAERLMASGRADTVCLVDLRAPVPGAYTAAFDALLASGRVTYHRGDVRAPLSVPPGPVDLIVNLAAVHREPGHAPHEYFDTNVPGAHHACQLADATGCPSLVFVSSIAVYGAGDGAHEAPRTEASPLAPTSPYGESKKAAEAVHEAWAAADPARALAIVRPGVVFGPGEGGNVTRMVQGVQRGRFAFVGSPDVPKAGLYVREFAEAVLFAMDQALAGRGNRGARVVVANLTADPAPTVGAYAQAILAVSGRRRGVPTVPLWAVLPAVTLAYAMARLMGRQPAWHPVRIRKLARPNRIAAEFLRQQAYAWRYPLPEALADWARLRPDEWRVA
jgi:nucleoside-diphosphate-sugar epimerase